MNEKDFPRLKEVIERAIQSKQFAKNRQKISGEAWQNKGNAACSVAEYLISKKQELESGPSEKRMRA